MVCGNPSPARFQPMPVEAPLVLHREAVLSEWIDYNGHMNMAYYVLVFDHGTDALLDYIGISESFREQHTCSTFTAEIHITYLKEAHLGDELLIKNQLLGFDQKRVHYFQQMHNANSGELLATAEMMSLYMDMRSRRVAAMPKPIIDKLHKIEQAHQDLPRPEQVGRIIGIRGARS